MQALNKVIAVEKSVKTTAYRKYTDHHKDCQKPALFAGISRTYRPKDVEGTVFPPESTKVQRRVEQDLREVSDVLTKWFDITAIKDYGNCKAVANVVVDGKTLLEAVPVTYLLFLEKQLTDLATFVEKLPTLDPSDSWSYNEAADCWATPPVESLKSTNVLRNHVQAEATKEHPAQVHMYNEPLVVGTWTAIKFSGAIPESRKNQLAERVEKLQSAVKIAREDANATEVSDQKVGDQFFDYLFGK